MHCDSRQPFKPREGSVPFIVYFTSRYRGMCVGSLVSRTAVITAAVCVTNPIADIRDKRPINVVTGTTYRHPRRGIRVQVTKLLVPNLKKIPQSNRGYLMSKSCAVMILKRKVPDALVEIPLRPIKIDYKGEETLSYQEECLMVGWHFFFKGDKIFPVNRFLLQRNLRAQFLNVVKKVVWCEALSMKFQKALSNLGFMGFFDQSAYLCVRDGMYGAPLICKGAAVGMLMAPDAQWSNCTGFSNLVHRFAGSYLTDFMACISKLFVEEDVMHWETMKKSFYDSSFEDYDFVPSLYDKLIPVDSSEEGH
ncbi:unnamed protein product [Arctia plantaginis]|uniref:Peptidase S1 domain-containing protein n=1 Tax=Arctia plantaginis TaxID=874455 RepID=A0A8S0Z6L3_ARCPL|nr:unnamed protein product [Arctia plantaginis]